MKLEQQLTSLQPSQRLKELGFKQESLYMYYKYTTDDVSFGIKEEYKIALGKPHKNTSEISAYTVAELGEMLPYEIEYKNQYWYWSTGKSGPNTDTYSYLLENAHIHKPVEYLLIGTENTEADARAKMLIYLVENKLITV